MTEIENALQLDTDTAIVLKIGEIIWRKTKKGDDTFSTLTEPERVFLYIDMLESQVNNGGFDQLFFNSSGDYVHEILSACEKIKAYKTKELLDKAIRLFPALPVPKDTEVRRKMMQGLNKNISTEWDNLDRKFYEYEDNIPALLIAYLKENKNDVGN